MRKLIILVGMLAVVSCVHKAELINISDGTIIEGTFNTGDKTLKVLMPDGEMLKGRYVTLSSASIGVSSLFYGTNTATMLTGSSGGVMDGYGFLRGDKGTIMEVIFRVGTDNHGFGDAKTNKGDTYKVMF